MWQLFTERGIQVIRLGQAEAAQMGSSNFGPEHLLLGLLQEGHGAAAQLLQKMNVQIDVARALVFAEVEPSHEAQTSEPWVTPRTIRTLELAADQARHFGHKSISTEHILYGLLFMRDELVAKILRRSGLETEVAQEQVRDYLALASTGKDNEGENAMGESARALLPQRLVAQLEDFPLEAPVAGHPYYGGSS